MTERERMKDRNRRMIKIAAAAVATCMYTCMSGQRRSLAHLNTHVSNKATGLTCSYLLQPFAMKIKCSATSTAPHQKYRGNQTVAENLKVSSFLCSLMCYLLRWTRILSQPITLTKLIGVCKFLIEFRRDVKVKPVFSSFYCIITLNMRNKAIPSRESRN